VPPHPKDRETEAGWLAVVLADWLGCSGSNGAASGCSGRPFSSRFARISATASAVAAPVGTPPARTSRVLQGRGGRGPAAARGQVGRSCRAAACPVDASAEGGSSRGWGSAAHRVPAPGALPRLSMRDVTIQLAFFLRSGRRRWERFSGSPFQSRFNSWPKVRKAASGLRSWCTSNRRSRSWPSSYPAGG